MVNIVAANLEGEATEWMTSLHDKEALELGKLVVFLE
ncbi:Cbp53E: Calbindin-32 [Crotalus adamanteus]|uniref:Cbp53E: Calbindin-32 n=1 Tax=Crotalus adamanteus TaxID=8729 RepID=A0AAW1BCC6_CROAD